MPVQNSAQPGAEPGEDERGGRRADRRRRQQGRQPHPREAGGEIDHEHRRDRHQAQRQEVGEGVAREPRLEPRHRRPGPARGPVAEGGAAGEEDGRRADEHAGQRRRPADDRAEQQPAGHGRDTGARHAGYDHQDERPDVAGEAREWMALYEAGKRLAVRGEVGQRQQTQLPGGGQPDEQGADDQQR